MARYVVPKDVTSALNFIAGARVKPSGGGRSFTFVEARTGKALCEVPTSDEKQVDEAVRAAKAAYPEWAALSGLERGKVMHKVAETIRENVEQIAYWEVRSNGKSITEARIDILSSADTWDFYGGLAPTVVGEHMPLGGPTRYAYTRREPLGVVGGIGAWNYPFQTATWKIAPALACGNAFVYKPSPLAPITAVILAELLTHCGIPKGVINIVQGEKETGEALCLHSDVNKVSFTGSVPTGQAIMKMCATRNIKPVTLELGGKSALIVFDDADIDNAVVGAMLANYLTQGEVCTNASRVFVHKSVVKEFTDKLLTEVKKLATKVGDPLLDETRMGATICQDHMNKVLGYIDSARKEGATILFGGERVTPSADEVKEGFYLSPCVITDTNDTMKVVREEIFGAVLLIIPFDNEEDAIERVNNTTFGLAAGLFSRNMRRAYQVAARLNAGTVFVNTYNDVDVAVPFGGVKNSGFGRENGMAALQHYTSIKSVYVDTSDKLESPF